MRSGLTSALVAAVVCLLASVASAQSLSSEQAQDGSFQSVQAHPAECARLRRQIDHFTTMAGRAELLENELWSSRMQEHVTLLRAMQAARCPGDVPVDTTAEAFKQLLELAARGAIAYFTFGAAGF